MSDLHILNKSNIYSTLLLSWDLTILPGKRLNGSTGGTTTFGTLYHHHPLHPHLGWARHPHHGKCKIILVDLGLGCGGAAYTLSWRLPWEVDSSLFSQAVSTTLHALLLSLPSASFTMTFVLICNIQLCMYMFQRTAYSTFSKAVSLPHCMLY